MEKTGTLLWIDLEMTGLDPEKDRILEVAAIATDWQLLCLAEMTAVVKVPEELMQERMVGDFWRKNRIAYEALFSQNERGEPAEVVEGRLLEFLDEHFKKESIKGDLRGAGKIILAGNSIHQDRKFIDKQWPKLAERLHYRMLDVSAFKVYFEGALNKKFTKPEMHRALDDIEGSIEELKWYLTFLK